MELLGGEVALAFEVDEGRVSGGEAVAKEEGAGDVAVADEGGKAADGFELAAEFFCVGDGFREESEGGGGAAGGDAEVVDGGGGRAGGGAADVVGELVEGGFDGFHPT